MTGELDLLLPLLKHDSLAVRHNAAVALLGDHREAAVAVLRDLDLTAPMEISFFSGFYLQRIGVPNTGSGFKAPETPIDVIPPKRRPRKTLRA